MWLQHEVLLGLVQASVGAVLAATMMVTSPMAYAAPFDTGTGMAPTGELHLSSCHSNHSIMQQQSNIMTSPAQALHNSSDDCTQDSSQRAPPLQ